MALDHRKVSWSKICCCVSVRKFVDTTRGEKSDK